MINMSFDAQGSLLEIRIKHHLGKCTIPVLSGFIKIKFYNNFQILWQKLPEVSIFKTVHLFNDMLLTSA